MKGKLIVICGTDGSGKATQAELLSQFLISQNHSIEHIDFPQYGEKSAGLVEEYLNGVYGTAEEVGPYRASIFYACDRYAAKSKMNSWLSKGKIIISNRYVTGNMAHQGGKISDPKEREKFLAWLEHLEYELFGIPKPDITLFLHVPSAIGQKLVETKEARDYIGGKKKDIHEADLEHLKKAEEMYLTLAKKEQWITIDCAPQGEILSKEKIAGKIRDALAPFL